MLSVSYDDGCGIITMVSKGLTDAKQIDALVQSLLPVMEKSRARHGHWLLLIDASHHSIQQQGSVSHVRDLWMMDGTVDGFIAYVTSSSLARMQIKRMQDGGNATFFDNVAAARDWLLSRGRGPTNPFGVDHEVRTAAHL